MVVSPEDIREEDFPGGDRREVDSEVTDAGPLEQVVSEAHPAMVAGGRWVEVLEVEGFTAEASAEVMVEDLAEAPGDSSTSELKNYQENRRTL